MGVSVADAAPFGSEADGDDNLEMVSRKGGVRILLDIVNLFNTDEPGQPEEAGYTSQRTRQGRTKRCEKTTDVLRWQHFLRFCCS